MYFSHTDNTRDELLNVFTQQEAIYTVGHKNVVLYFCPYLCQLLTDFQNSFTGADILQ